MDTFSSISKNIRYFFNNRMATASTTNPFDCLPDELVEYIFLLVVDSPPIEPFNHVNVSSSLFYFSYILHKPYLRRTFKDLLSVGRVCRRFHKILEPSAFWLRKCHDNHVLIVNEPLAISQGIDFRRLYFSNPFHPDYNLLKLDNKNQNNERQFWSPSVTWEKTPIGCDSLNDEFGQMSSCFATSHYWGEYHRDNIPLLQKGQEKLISINPVIEFTVCVTGRWDCSSECQLQLSFSDGHTWRHTCSFANGDCQWRRITYRYVDYPKDKMPSHISVLLRGKDRQNWAGNYGTKFAQIKLRLALRQENEKDNQQLEQQLTDPNKSS